MKEIALFFVALGAQYAFVIGASYVGYRFLSIRSFYLKAVRRITRAFAVVACLFLLAVLLIRQPISPESRWWIVVAPLWTASIFVAHDVALGLAIRWQDTGQGEQ